MIIGFELQIVILGILLAISFFFSGTETAFFSLSRLERDALNRKAAPFQRKVIQRLLGSPDEILVTILTGNMIVNVFASALAEEIGRRVFTFDSELFSIASMTLLLLLVGEMTPKILAVHNTLAFARAASVPIFYVHRLLTPLRWLLTRASFLLAAPQPGPAATPRQRADGLILSAIKLGHKRGILNQSEEHLFRSFFAFQEKTADEVKIPRSQLRGVPDSAAVPQLIGMVEREPIAVSGDYILVHQRDMDHLLGYLHVRDLLPYKYGLKAEEPLASILRPFYIVPESKDLIALMLEMAEHNSELALVVDEYGGTAGIVTFQQMVEEILGYFYPSETDTITQIEPNRYILQGDLDLERLQELFGVEVDSDSRTVAGLLFEQLGEIPEPGTRVPVAGLEFTVRRTARNRILEVEARKAGPA